MTLTLFTNMNHIDTLLNAPNTYTTHNQKRWHNAFITIYCSRAFNSHFTNKPKITPIQSFTVLDINSPHSFTIDQQTLIHLVKDKNIETLHTHAGGLEGIASSLQTNTDFGINHDSEDIAIRKQVFGSNTYNKPPSKSFIHFVLEAFKDVTILILLVCASLSLGFGIKEHGIKEGWYDGGSIFLAVFIVISMSSISNFKQNKQFDKLSQVSNGIQIDLVRSGRRQKVSIFEIVVGDIVCLKIGDQVPADGLFVDGHSLRVDESSMTGESDHVEISKHHHPFLFSGTKVADGYAKMLVTSVGMNTTWGQMMSSISNDNDEETPLQTRLNKLTSSIGKGGLAVAFLVLVVLLIRYFTGNTETDNGVREFNGRKTSFDEVMNAVIGIISDAVTIVVVAIPEGLPLAVTLTLAYSMKKMMADQAMVRKLSACETMGSATTICTDKTGTLTLNQMKVTKFWLGLEPLEEGAYLNVDPFVLQLIKEGVAHNTTGGVHESKSDSDSKFEFSGSPTEKAILSWAVSELNMEMETLTKSCSIIQVETFNSKKKRSGVLLRRNIDNKINAHWKGAAEMVLRMCSKYYDAYGIAKHLDNETMSKFESIIQGMAASSLRCIAFAYAEVEVQELGDEGENSKIMVKDNGLTLLGLVGIKDPCRPGVKTAVEACQHAGVNVKMITGDNIFTAKAIAFECGILRANQDTDETVIEGEQFRNFTHEERLEKVEKISVMARSSPFDKLLMVQCLKEKGHVVAVTGDGTNDAPALKEADIGLSMGIQGTEVAKESSDIVILDDNFASIVTVLNWGRCVYNNIQKFIQFQLTVNVAALVINFVAAVSAGEVPLTAVQLLWVNLIMDTLGALALATEKPTKELMDQKPVGRTKPLITNIMWRNLLSQAFYQIVILLTLQFKGEAIFGLTSKVNDTLIFNTFVLCQVFNEFNARKLEKKNVFEGIFKSKLFMGIVGVTLVLQVVMVEFLKKFADTERLNWREWIICIGLASVSWPIGFVVKLLPVSDKPLLDFLSLRKRL
ncbi:putative calcium-transporting ATPase 13, plasma membrane-type [Vicia villosa]|uniref:putative calcium-transporting ATPase 13, plasma membrane-type n=1 Tax=Vicia villosa TaxID=3911 RepID=UPI00273B7E41|nr:putative calcium-transporting ATPase 13, plasma membrane-type [Vicia villosa]